MGEPIWIDCSSIEGVYPPERLAAMTHSGDHVVLRFSSLSDSEKWELIHRFGAALPDHSVFDSGGSSDRPWITLKPVVARSRVLERREAILDAIRDYRRTYIDLVCRYRTGRLGRTGWLRRREWRDDEHGGHCRFVNRRTGQVVEAPFCEWVDPDGVDPYFFAAFVRSTPGLESVAELLSHDYHDAARMLLVVECD